MKIPRFDETATRSMQHVHQADDATQPLRSSADELLLDRYVVSGTAGQGSFASVVVAWDMRIQRKVAIKCMPLEHAATLFPEQQGSILVGESPFDTSSITGLEEARTAAMLSDASIVSVYDFEVKDGMAYLILEYVEGMTLADLLRCFPDDINADIVAAVFKAVSHALEVAHNHHVLHLDIKPENVLIDKQGQVKVTDFGLARLATETGYGHAVGGTIGYMPPEQMLGNELDERCDQWALASLTYEMISGENPFMADSLEGAEDAIYDAELVIPSLCMEGLDLDIDDIMFCALDPDPTERYDSVKDFATQLQPCLGSTRKGKNALKRLVGRSEEEDSRYDDTEEMESLQQTPYDQVREQMSTWSWHMPARLRAFGMRLWSVAGSGIVGLLAINTFVGLDAWPDQPVAWIVLAAITVLAGILPGVGALCASVCWAVSMCLYDAPVCGLVLLVAAPLWWYYGARSCVEAANVGMSSVLFGAIGMAPLVPFVAGFLLPVRKALLSTLYAALMALMLAGLGSASLLGWDITSYGTVAISAQFAAVVASFVVIPSTWLTILAWVLAALVASLLCSMGKKVWCVFGMLVACACQIAGVILGSLANTFGAHVLEDPLVLAPVIGSSVLGVLLGCCALPSRTQKPHS